MFTRIKNTVKEAGKEIRNQVAFYSTCQKKIEELSEQVNWFMLHSDITSLKPATGYLRKKQLDLVNFANEFFEFVKELHISPFLIGGTLIGSFRHKGFIPWDDDIDFGLMRQDYEKLINFCKNNCIVEIYHGKWSEYNSDKHIERIDELVKKYPNEYILDIWVDQIQITKGTSCIDRMAIDFFAYDYYCEGYTIQEHKDYLKRIDQKRKEIDYVNEIIDFLCMERTNNKNIAKEETSLIFPGIDHLGSYCLAETVDDWIRKDAVFPLACVQFENVFWKVPNSIEGFLKYVYPNFMDFPKDAGIPLHEGYKERYIIKNMPTVEFYLVDAFEIYHFLPLYYHFEKKGIYSKFIAEPNEINTSATWFDYATAKKILEANEVRYGEKCNPLVDFSFTTQDAYILEKYKNYKIHMPYGVGLSLNSYMVSERTITGFDLKLVHGDFTKQLLLKKKTDDCIFVDIGYPKFEVMHDAIYCEEQECIEDLLEKVKNQTKPVLLYFPTWGENSSIRKYAGEIEKLKKDFFVISKAHHCTSRLESEKENFQLLHSCSDVVLNGNSCYKEIISLGDIAIADALSGAATEIPFLNPEIKLILLYSPVKENNVYQDIINEFAICVQDCQKLETVVREISVVDENIDKRKEYISSMFGVCDEDKLACLDDHIIRGHDICMKRREKKCKL